MTSFRIFNGWVYENTGWFETREAAQEMQTSLRAGRKYRIIPMHDGFVLWARKE